MKYPRFLTLLILCSCPLFQAWSQTLMGGTLSYELGKSGSLYTYSVTLILFQVPDSTFYNHPKQVTISSSCFPDTVVTLQPAYSQIGDPHGTGVARFNPRTNCFDTIVPDTLTPLIYTYMGLVTLPGKCHNFQFSYYQCCRNKYLTNIVNPDSTGFYLRSLLNNTRGPNSSAELFSAPRYLFCKGVPVNTYHHFWEDDGDSISFQFTAAMDSAGVPAQYSSGFSFHNPFNSSNPFTPTGFTPASSGVMEVVLQANEYRFDAVYGWIPVGSAILDLNYVIREHCGPNLQSTFFGGPGITDTLEDQHCGDNFIALKTRLFSEFSLTPDGSEFRLLTSDSTVVPITGVTIPYTRPDLLTDSIILHLFQPLPPNDTLFIYLKKGFDGNTMLSYCGNEFPAYDTAVVITDNCQYFNEEELAGSQEFSIYPNPAQNEIAIEVNENFTSGLITLFDMRGQKLRTVVPHSPQTKLDVSGLSPGIYLVRIRINEHEEVRLVEKL